MAKTTNQTSDTYRFGKIKLSYKQLVWSILAATLLLFGASGYVWYKNIFTDPDRLLGDMLNKTLQVDSLQRKTIQSGSQSATNQIYYNVFSPVVAVESRVDLREGDLSSDRVTKVTNETIATPSKDFVRYTSISLPDGSAQKDFGNIINHWAKRENNKDTGESVSFFNQSLFAIVPFGNLNSQQRKELISEIDKQKLYQYKSNKIHFENGRPVMVYEIDLKPEALLRVLSLYSKLTGYGEEGQFDAEQYKDAPAVPVKLSLDVWSRHLRQVEYVGAQQVDRYGAYGLRRNIELPGTTISVDELQNRLQKIQ